MLFICPEPAAGWCKTEKWGDKGYQCPHAVPHKYLGADSCGTPSGNCTKVCIETESGNPIQ